MMVKLHRAVVAEREQENSKRAAAEQQNQIVEGFCAFLNQSVKL